MLQNSVYPLTHAPSLIRKIHKSKQIPTYLQNTRFHRKALSLKKTTKEGEVLGWRLGVTEVAATLGWYFRFHFLSPSHH